MDIRNVVLKLFSAQLFLAVLEFGAIVYFTQSLGAAAIGSFFLYQSSVGLMAIPSNLGLRRAAEKELSAGEAPGEVIGTTVVLKALLLLPFLVGIVLANQYVDAYIDVQGVWMYVAIGLVTIQARRLVIRLLAGQMRVGQTASLRVFGKMTWLIAGVVLIYLGMDALAILIAFILGDVIVVAGALFRLNLTFAKPTVRRSKSLLSYGRYIFLRSSGSYIYSWMDVAILGLFVSTGLVGAYEIAWRVASFGLQLTNAIRESIFPGISQLHARGELEEIRQLIYRWVQPPLYLTIPALFGALVIGDEVLRVPFGQQVVVAFPVLVIFMGEKIMRTGHLLFSAAVFAMDRPDLGYRGEVTGLSINLVLNLVLIPKFGILGAAVATATSSVVTALVNGYYLSTMIDLWIPWRKIAWSSVCASAMATLVYLLKPSLPKGLIGLVVGIVAGVLLYTLFMAMNGGIRHEIRSFRHVID